MTSQITSRTTYFVIYVMLLALLALTVLVAQLHLGPFNLWAAMTIALVKGLLVALYFMHVRHSQPLLRVFACAGYLWLAILIVLTLSDVVTR